MAHKAEKIRNLCLLGHRGNGKTTLIEALLFQNGKIDRQGTIDQGNTVCDYDAEEIKRKTSISLSAASFTYKDVKINVIDSPGFYDFEGETISAVTAGDVAMIVASAKQTVSVGAEKAVKLANKYHKPTVYLVTNLDDEKANFYTTVGQLCEKFDATKIVPVWVPLCEGEKVVGVVDVVANKAWKYDGANKTEAAVPADLVDKIAEYRTQIMEAIAETDEALMEKFFAEEEFTAEELSNGWTAAIAQRTLYPVLLCNPATRMGVDLLTSFIVDHFPAPNACASVVAKDKNGTDVTLSYDENGPTVLQVFKTLVDPFVGKLSLFKVLSGTVKRDESYLVVRTDEKEKISHVYTPFGKKQEEVDVLYAGDVGVFTKVASLRTGDTLCDKSNVIVAPDIEFSHATFSRAVVAQNKGDEEKISQGIMRLIEEDPTLSLVNNKETKQLILSGMGDMQLDVVVSKLAAKPFLVNVLLSDVKVAYRETIKKKVKVEGKHKKQSGGHGQYGHVWIEFEPCFDEDFVFAETVFGGAVPKNFFPAVEKGLRESILSGVLAGYPVTGVKATLTDGSYHPVDSSEMAFKIAASIAFKEGMKQAAPTLLEPIGRLKVNVSDALMGDIIGDINKRRGQVLSMDSAPEKGRKIVEADVPMSEMGDYAMGLRSMTHARATFRFDFLEYREAPMNIVDKVVKEAAQ